MTDQEYLATVRLILDGELPRKTIAVSEDSWKRAQSIVAKTLGASNETYIHPNLLSGLCEHIAEALKD